MSLVFFAPVMIILPLLKMSITVFGCSRRNTRPGNCSGSYSVFTHSVASRSRFIFSSRSDEATMFCISTLGFPLRRMPASFSFLRNFSRAVSMSFLSRAPVHITLPELKMSIASLGSLTLNTTPGKFSGLYSTPEAFEAKFFMSIFWFNVMAETMFSMWVLNVILILRKILYDTEIYIKY